MSLREVLESQIRKWLTPTIRDKKVTYSNSSIKLWIDRKYATDLMLVEIYKKRFVFLVTATLKDITNHSLELVFSSLKLKTVFTIAYSI